uniref:ETFB lysine methyltransferase n=1 Tax=Cajanus cajan TaxID=3821 RepID=A0A151SIA2_CAJCA|nr:Ribosomal protein L11 methyltransferase [Cajanus cajan]
MDQDDVSQSIDEICISSIFHEVEDINVSISHAADSIGLKEIPRYVVKTNEEDWVKKSQESFHPVQVTEGLWVVPKWCTPPDVQATNIFVNPGLAFGTGEHSTTKLCLLLLQGYIKGGEHILDYGTGTGILAIAALKLTFGAAFAVGVDVDSQAIASASENASLNNIGPDKLQLHLVSCKASSSSQNDLTFGVMEGQNTCEIQAVITHRDKFDVVIANILLNPLLDLADQIISLAKPGAVVGLSGILSEQVQYIVERYSPFLEGIEVSKMDDWACVSGRKK